MSVNPIDAAKIIKVAKDIADGAKAIAEGAKEMGFVDDVKDIGRAIAKTAKNVVKSIKEKFKTKSEEKTNKDLEKAHEENKRLKKELEREKEKNAEKIAESLGDEVCDVDTANAYEIRQMNDDLYEMQENFRKTASGIEDNILECIQGTVHDLLEQFEGINEQSGLNLNMAYLKSMENSLSAQVTGFIQNRVRRFLSIDNPECKDILRMEGKTAKKMAMNRFQEKIISDAVNDLWRIVKDTFEEQNSAIFLQIENRFRTMEMNAEESIRQFEEIQKTMQQDKNTLKEKQETYQNMIDIASWCMNSMESDNLA